MSHDPAAVVHAAMETSELVRAAASVRRDLGITLALGDVRLRPLSGKEIARLTSGGNTCADWSRIRVAQGFDARRVRDSTFHGDVVLGRFTADVAVTEAFSQPAGVYDSTVADCVIGHEALVQNVRLLHNQVIGPAALLFDCGRVVCTGPTAFGNGLEMPLGFEGGGRNVPAYAEIDLETARSIAMRRSERDLLRRYFQAVREYVAQATSPRGIVERGAVVRGVRQISNCYIGPFALVDGATLVGSSTLLSNESEPVRIVSGACVTQSLFQWGSQARSLAVVERSVLAEHAYAEKHAKVTGSFVGPNSGAAEGEVTSSLLGPLVGFHHQALLIAALWPEGKGNVAHGASLGSNHNSRTPDQEFRPGEGMFFGLGSSVTFPADFSQAVYSLIASGVHTLPQRMTFPFSLMNGPSAVLPGIPPSFNEIMPAWMLSDNLYALQRNEMKFRERYRARRTPIHTSVFRPHVQRLMHEAWSRLEAVATIREVYTEGHIAGLGKNYLLEKHRKRAAAAYRFHLLLQALLALKERVEAFQEQGRDGDVNPILQEAREDVHWEFQRTLLWEEGGFREAETALEALPEILETRAAEVERSRAKDDERGRRIIADYADVHVPASADPVVQQTRREARRLQRETETLLARLSKRKLVATG
jgi:hypothetical protein